MLNEKDGAPPGDNSGAARQGPARPMLGPRLSARCKLSDRRRWGSRSSATSAVVSCAAVCPAPGTARLRTRAWSAAAAAAKSAQGGRPSYRGFPWPAAAPASLAAAGRLLASCPGRSLAPQREACLPGNDLPRNSSHLLATLTWPPQLAFHHWPQAGLQLHQRRRRQHRVLSEGRRLAVATSSPAVLSGRPRAPFGATCGAGAGCHSDRRARRRRRPARACSRRARAPFANRWAPTHWSTAWDEHRRSRRTVGGGCALSRRPYARPELSAPIRWAWLANVHPCGQQTPGWSWHCSPARPLGRGLGSC
mmetsp:Transcript_32202/g.72498  ORF Transcript_32202/g.72498 Transcript_32202/m.72498 type:complete len:307 (+) Transcript_32202:24-944(+)